MDELSEVLLVGGQEVARAHAILPHSVSSYLKSPRYTYCRARDWLNARLQLRQCTHVGRWTRVAGRLFVNNMGTIAVGERVRIESRYVHSVLTAQRGGRLEIGDGTFLNYAADIVATQLVQIGRDCLIGTHCIILDNDFHSLTDRRCLPEPRPVIIEDGVWLGNRVTVLPGVRIGTGAVIGAGSVVTSDISARSVAVGNPARVIKQL